MLALGLVVPMMFLVGGLFVVLWIVSIRLGGRIDRERAAYDAEHPRPRPTPADPHGAHAAGRPPAGRGPRPGGR